MSVDPVDFEKRIADYLDSKQVYSLFQELLLELSLRQPEDPAAFLVEKLKSKPKMRIFTFGASGDDVNHICSSVATSCGYKIISAAEVSKALDHTHTSFDDELSHRLSAEVEKCESDAACQGYMVVGFPSNRAQSRSMQQFWKVIPSRVILFRRAGAESDINVPGVCELFRNVLREFEITSDSTSDAQAKALTKLISLNVSSLAPTRPRSVCLIGVSGSGRSSQARALAEHYGLVLISASSVIQQSTGKSMLFDEATDEECCQAVQRRLSHEDCLRTGWVLEGFPRNLVQAQFLKNHYKPKVIEIQVSEQEANKRRNTSNATSAVAFEKFIQGINQVKEEHHVLSVPSDGKNIQQVQQHIQAFIDSPIAY